MIKCFLLPLLTVFLLAVPIGSRAESYVGWTKARKLERRVKLCASLEKEIQERATRLGKEIGQPFAVVYQFPASEKEKAKMAAAWTAKKFKEEDVLARWQDLMRISKDLSAKEAEARPKWQEKMKDILAAADKAEKEGSIYGTRIKARKLGAILDNSPSMAKYLPALRKEIAHAFEDYPSVEVWGSFLNRFTVHTLRLPGSSEDWIDTRWFHATPGEATDPFDPAWHFPVNFPGVSADELHMYDLLMERDNVSAILAMVELHKVNAIYWFCDLRDKVDPEAVRRLGEVIRKNKVALYVHTVGRKPQDELMTLVTMSGGGVITEKPRVIPADKPAR